MEEVGGLTRELYRRQARKSRRRVERPARLADFLAGFFDRQQQVIDAVERWVALLCPRRAGKSTVIPGKLYSGMEDWRAKVGPCIGLYIHPDGRPRAIETLWKPMLAINDAYNLGWTPNGTTATLSKDDGTEIRFRGADDAREAQKFRGDTRPIAIAVADEAQNFPDGVLRTLVDDSLGPALADVQGQFVLAGTPGVACSGLWYEVSGNDNDEAIRNRLARWRVVTWSNLHNPHRRENIAAEIADRLAPVVQMTPDAVLEVLLGANGPEMGAALAEADPSTLREFFGRWVRDSEALFYAFDGVTNVYDGTLPSGHHWYYVLGGDLGTGDAYAHHIWAVSPTHPIAYEVESFEKPGLHAGQWRQHYQEAIARWRPARCVVDEGGLGHGVAKEWREVYSIPVEPAEKTYKAAAVATFNAEARSGRVKLLANGATARTMASLRKSLIVQPGKPAAEDPTQPNHASDAALYGHRECMRLVGRKDVPLLAPAPNTPEAARAEEAALLKKALERVEARREEESENEFW